jgi:hypothetical protein
MPGGGAEGVDVDGAMALVPEGVFLRKKEGIILARAMSVEAYDWPAA